MCYEFLDMIKNIAYIDVKKKKMISKNVFFCDIELFYYIIST